MHDHEILIGKDEAGKMDINDAILFSMKKSKESGKEVGFSFSRSSRRLTSSIFSGSDDDIPFPSQVDSDDMTGSFHTHPNQDKCAPSHADFIQGFKWKGVEEMMIGCVNNGTVLVLEKQDIEASPMYHDALYKDHAVQYNMGKRIDLLVEKFKRVLRPDDRNWRDREGDLPPWLNAETH